MQSLSSCFNIQDDGSIEKGFVGGWCLWLSQLNIRAGTKTQTRGMGVSPRGTGKVVNV